MPEVSSRNTRHERLGRIYAFVVAVYCYAHAIRTYLRQEPLTYFSNAAPFYENFLVRHHCGTTLPDASRGLAHEHNLYGTGTGLR